MYVYNKKNMLIRMCPSYKKIAKKTIRITNYPLVQNLK